MLDRALGAWIPVVLWAILILGLGSDTFSAEHTSRILGPLLDWLLPGVQASTRSELLAGVRKSAHVFEYGVLALLAFRALRRVTARPAVLCAGLALLVVAGIATADERHQATTPHRTGTHRDVALDVTGGAAALTGLFAVHSLRRRRHAKATA